MLRMITQGRELKEDWRTLAELKLREPYGIHVMRRQPTSAASSQRAAAPLRFCRKADAKPDRFALGKPPIRDLCKGPKSAFTGA